MTKERLERVLFLVSNCTSCNSNGGGARGRVGPSGPRFLRRPHLRRHLSIGALFVDHDALVADVFALDGQHHILAVFELHDVRKLPIFLGIGDLFNTFALDVLDAHGQFYLQAPANPNHL